MMRNILKKLHIMPAQSEEGVSSSSSSQQPQPQPPPSGSHRHHPEQKPLSGLSGWLNSVTGRHNSSPPSPLSGRGERSDQTDEAGSLSLAGLESALLETVRRDSEESSVRDPEMEEEYQIQLALELSAREDPEAVQIEAVKQISLGSCAPQNTPAEVLAYRYWNYNSLGYDDKILDGFYDLYGILGESTSEMPSLIDLQQIPVSDSISWEAVLVNRAEDGDLLNLEERALMMAVASRSGSAFFTPNDLVRKLAALVAEYMGGPVVDPEKMLKDWSNLSNHLRALVGNMVLPLGQLKIGLARHRALLFKVLADSVGIQCQLIKGQQYTGADDGAMNIIKIDGREYIVDVMAEPGTLIPSDAVGPQMEYEDSFVELSPVFRGASSSNIGSCSISSGVSSSIGGCPEDAAVDKTSRSGNLAIVDSGFDEQCGFGELSAQETRPTSSSKESSSKGLQADSSDEKSQLYGSSGRPSAPYAHGRSPSWTEGVSSPAVRRMKVKDVSQYMIDAAKENPKLAQKLHDVLLESGVVAPPDLFTEAYSEQLPSPTEGRNQTGDTDEKKQRKDGTRHRHQADAVQGRYLPPLPHHGMQSKLNPSRIHMEQEACSPSSHSEASATSTQEMSPGSFVKHMPVAAAAAATAAVVASSMVVAAAKSSNDSCLEVPVAAAATATAAAVVATTAAVSRQYEQLESGALLLGGAPNLTQPDRQKDGDGDGVGNESQGIDHKHASGDKLEHGSGGAHQEGERISDRSTGAESVRSEAALEDVAEWEILWDEITLGERIGLGSYGEVYRGDWHGTEVAVKKFLDQDISGDALAEFISEVRIMKRLRHPNVVLFMGAVIRAPHLSIVTEFLPRGSLYRLIHRPNNQLDARKRLKMALDVARGMNYLHNFKPAIVHRDLKSPNLLVDRNWNVKVCDFGLSRMKHNTFLSSSTAGTAEWMAPEVLQNEPSDEKCDVYSYGVILWELTTMQQPWSGMNPMQVVGAVGFQHRRLDIPDDVDPIIADIIKKCWQTDPKLRPSFSEIMASLRPLQKSLVSQVSRQRASLSGDRGLHLAGQPPERDQTAAGDDEVEAICRGWMWSCGY